MQANEKQKARCCAQRMRVKLQCTKGTNCGKGNIYLAFLRERRHCKGGKCIALKGLTTRDQFSNTCNYSCMVLTLCHIRYIASRSSHDAKPIFMSDVRLDLLHITGQRLEKKGGGGNTTRLVVQTGHW